MGIIEEIPADSGGVYPAEFLCDFGSDTEGRPSGDVGHLLPHKRSEDFPIFVSEKRLDQTEAADALAGVDTPALPVWRAAFFQLEFHHLTVSINYDRFCRCSL